MCPWWLTVSVVLMSLFIGLIAGIWLSGDLVGDGPPEEPELPVEVLDDGEDTDPGSVWYAGRFPLH